MKKQILNEEFLRMQKLAGILTEEFNSETFKWKNSPKNPNDMVEILDIGDDEDEDSNKELMSKKDFWNGNIIGISREESIPAYGEFKNGSWAFIWDDGDVEISGFKEGEDFTL